MTPASAEVVPKLMVDPEYLYDASEISPLTLVLASKRQDAPKDPKYADVSMPFPSGKRRI
jgi:hypothetical protein